MRNFLTTCAVAFVLVCGCAKNNQSEWDALSKRVEEYVSHNGGSVVRTNDRSTDHHWKRWIIVFPTDSVAQEALFQHSEGLVAAVSTGQDGLQWGGSGRKDPKVYEKSKDGRFSTGSGPAPVWESIVSGEDVSVLLTSSGMAKTTSGLSHYDRISREWDQPSTKLLIELDLIVIK